ncbi:MAG TPA: cupin domain-containing protein [Candidatus Limnocylindria bacterium]
MSGDIRLPDLGLTVRAATADTGGRLSLIESAGQTPGTGPRRHVHAREDEAFFVIEGSYFWELGGERLSATAGSFIWLPRGVPHRFIVGPSGGRMLHLFMPGGIDRYFVEWQTAIASGETDEFTAALAERYGLAYENIPQ